jgi:hypothetical protein
MNPTAEQVYALAEAMEQLLDDMGPDRQSVCLAAKAKAHIAYEPFREMMGDEMPECYMPMADAERIIQECGG